MCNIDFGSNVKKYSGNKSKNPFLKLVLKKHEANQIFKSLVLFHSKLRLHIIIFTFESSVYFLRYLTGAVLLLHMVHITDIYYMRF